jgi:RNA 2',3'-cyclic 3'-phosphodiesterase
VRLFLAIEIEEPVVERVVQLGDELRRRVERLAPNARLTWIPRERMHLTVRFIGEVEESRSDEIRAGLAPPLDTPAFTMTLEGAGAFPKHGPPRVLWAGIAHGQAELVALEQEVSARLLRCGLPAEDRSYRPHLTLARVREARGLRTDALFDGLDAMLGTSAVRAITLFQSRLSPRGPAYLALQSTNLRWKN